MRIAVGVDLHSKTAVAHAVHAGGGEPGMREAEFLDGFNREFGGVPSTPEEMRRMAAALRGRDACVLLENSTKTHETYWVLTNAGCKVTVAFAADLYRITKSVKKTDRNDAMELAAYMRRRMNGENEFSECYMPSLDWMMKREICRTVFWEKRHLADLKRRVRSHLLLHGITLSREYSDIFSRKATEEMRRTKDPCLLIAISEAESIKRRTDDEARLIQHLFSGDRMYGMIYSIPGFGSISAAYLTSLIVDISRFRNSSSFSAYFGIVPKVRNSADSSPRCQTTHRGDEDARRLLCQSAMVHIRTVEDSVVTRMYHRLTGNGKAHKEALVACARKLTTVVWSVVRSGLPFTDDAGLLARADGAIEGVEEEMAEES